MQDKSTEIQGDLEMLNECLVSVSEDCGGFPDVLHCQDVEADCLTVLIIFSMGIYRLVLE